MGVVKHWNKDPMMWRISLFRRCSTLD